MQNKTLDVSSRIPRAIVSLYLTVAQLDYSAICSPRIVTVEEAVSAIPNPFC
jgi:hypothetical protein